MLDHLLYPILHLDDPTSDNYMIYGEVTDCILLVMCRARVLNFWCSSFRQTVDGREGLGGIERLIDHGQAAVGFVVGAVSTAQIMKVADADQLLPAKVRLSV